MPRKPKVYVNGTYRCSCGVLNQDGRNSGIDLYQCIKCGRAHMNGNIDFTDVSIDQLYKLHKVVDVECARKEIAILKMVKRIISTHFRRGAVITQNHYRYRSVRILSVTKVCDNLIWYRVQNARKKKSCLQCLDLELAPYSVFTSISTIERRGKVVYSRLDFLKMYNATCFKKLWALR